jgi:hypothetical protein
MTEVETNMEGDNSGIHHEAHSPTEVAAGNRRQVVEAELQLLKQTWNTSLREENLEITDSRWISKRRFRDQCRSTTELYINLMSTNSRINKEMTSRLEWKPGRHIT